MKKLILLILLITSQSILAQGVYAGLNTNSDYHFSFNPPYELEPADTNSTNFIELDLNNDNINDIKISAYYFEGYQLAQEKRLTIENINNSQIAIGGSDTCYTFHDPPEYISEYAFHIDPAHKLEYLDVIDDILTWTDSVVTLSYNLWYMNYWPLSTPIYCNYQSGLLVDTGYIAVRLIEETDTIYSWIQLSDVDVNSCTIYSYACKTQPLNLIEQSPQLNLYPNPAKNQITLHSETQLHSVELINLLGKQIGKHQIDSNKCTIPVQNYPHGLYILNVIYSSGVTLNRKMIIE